MNSLQTEIDRNFDAFQRVLSQYLPLHRGEWALLRHGRVVSLHPNAASAEGTGLSLYDDDLFSVQEVSDEVVDLGFFSHVVA